MDSSKEFEQAFLQRVYGVGSIQSLKDSGTDDWRDAEYVLACHHKATQERVREAEIDLLYEVLEADDGQKGNDYKVFQAVYNKLTQLEQQAKLEGGA
jgi:hypothetical protein